MTRTFMYLLLRIDVILTLSGAHKVSVYKCYEQLPGKKKSGIRIMQHWTLFLCSGLTSESDKETCAH